MWRSVRRRCCVHNQNDCRSSENVSHSHSHDGERLIARYCLTGLIFPTCSRKTMKWKRNRHIYAAVGRSDFSTRCTRSDYRGSIQNVWQRSFPNSQLTCSSKFGAPTPLRVKTNAPLTSTLPPPSSSQYCAPLKNTLCWCFPAFFFWGGGGGAEEGRVRTFELVPWFCWHSSGDRSNFGRLANRSKVFLLVNNFFLLMNNKAFATITLLLVFFSPIFF